MEKKKVTLSLEEDVVDRAKRQGLNMSEAANTALKEKTFLNTLSEGERKFRKIIEDAREEGGVASLPIEIKSLKLKNIGKFEDKKFEFGPQNTVIYGPNESGKSTIIHAIKSFFGKEDGELVNYKKNSGKIEVETSENKGEFKLNKSEPSQGRCLVVDDLLAGLSNKKAERAVEELKNEYSEQIILTTRRRDIAEMFENQIKLTSVNESRLDELKEDLANIEEDLEDKKMRYRELQKEKEKLENKYEEKISNRGEINAMRERLESLEKEIEVNKKRISERKAKANSIEKEIDEAEDEREKGRLEERKDRAVKEKEELEEKLKELKEKKEKLEEDLNKKEEVETELEKIKGKKDRISMDISEVQEEIETLREEKTHLESEIEEVEDKL